MSECVRSGSVVEYIHAPESFDGSEGLLAILVPGDYHGDGTSRAVEFFTTPDLPQQLAYMRHAAGKVIPPHIHHEYRREVRRTCEVLVIRSGVVRVDFFTSGRESAGSRTLRTGDTLLIVAGGHSFTVLEDVEMVELKSGPYNPSLDKVYF